MSTALTPQPRRRRPEEPAPAATSCLARLPPHIRPRQSRGHDLPGPAPRAIRPHPAPDARLFRVRTRI